MGDVFISNSTLARVFKWLCENESELGSETERIANLIGLSRRGFIEARKRLIEIGWIGLLGFGPGKPSKVTIVKKPAQGNQPRQPREYTTGSSRESERASRELKSQPREYTTGSSRESTKGIEPKSPPRTPPLEKSGASIPPLRSGISAAPVGASPQPFIFKTSTGAELTSGQLRLRAHRIETDRLPDQDIARLLAGRGRIAELKPVFVRGLGDHIEETYRRAWGKAHHTDGRHCKISDSARKSLEKAALIWLDEWRTRTMTAEQFVDAAQATRPNKAHSRFVTPSWLGCDKMAEIIHEWSPEILDAEDQDILDAPWLNERWCWETASELPFDNVGSCKVLPWIGVDHGNQRMALPHEVVVPKVETYNLWDFIDP